MILTAGAVLIASTAADAAKLSATQTKYLSQADSGVSAASAWNNSKFHWYNKVLNDTKRSPLAAIWDVVPLWESVDYDAMVQPTAANLALVKKFATHAEGYWDTHVTPSKGVRTRTPAYAPYPGSYTDPKTFFDDNAWWGLAFMDSYAVTKQLPLPLRRQAGLQLHRQERLVQTRAVAECVVEHVPHDPLG